MSLLAVIALVLAIIAAVWIVVERPPSPPRPWPLLLVAVAVILLALSGSFDVNITD